MNRFTLFGALQYDPTLFDDIALPENIDKQILLDTIIQHCGDLKPYYQHPLMLKHNITSWFSRMYFSFDKMMGALKSEFNPIENYDRYEERHTSESESSSESSSESASASTASSLSESSSANHSESELHDVSAYNESGYSPADQNRIAGKDSTSNSSDTNTNQKSNRSTNLSTNHIRRYGETSHLHGNIGVTRADEMIRTTIDMYEEIDVYNIIARMFEKEFLIQIY